MVARERDAGRLYVSGYRKRIKEKEQFLGFFMTNKTATILENIVLFDVSAYA